MLLESAVCGIKKIPRLESHWNSFFGEIPPIGIALFLATCGGGRLDFPDASRA